MNKRTAELLRLINEEIKNACRYGELITGKRKEALLVLVHYAESLEASDPQVRHEADRLQLLIQENSPLDDPACNFFDNDGTLDLDIGD